MNRLNRILAASARPLAVLLPAVLLATALAAPLARAQAPVATLRVLEGSARVFGAGGGRTLAAGEAAALQPGSRVQTDPGGQALLRHTGDVVAFTALVGPDADLTALPLRRDAGTGPLRLERGELRVLGGRYFRDAPLVSTPTAHLYVTDVEFHVAVPRPDVTRVVGVSGIVAVRSRAHPAHWVRVKPGLQGEVVAGRRPHGPMLAPYPARSRVFFAMGVPPDTMAQQ